MPNINVLYLSIKLVILYHLNGHTDSQQCNKNFIYSLTHSRSLQGNEAINSETIVLFDRNSNIKVHMFVHILCITNRRTGS